MSRKPLFDIVRRLMGRGLRQSEVDAIDRAIDDLKTAGSSALQEAVPLTASPEGIRLIKRYEGCARLRSDGLVEAYPDPGTGGHPWTIGWGATGAAIGPGTVWTREHCDARLMDDVARHARDVAKTLADAPTSQRQFDALVSFHYNTGAIAGANLTRLHRAGDFTAAANEFARWNKAGGRVLKGLVRRRREEAALYRSGS